MKPRLFPLAAVILFFLAVLPARAGEPLKPQFQNPRVRELTDRAWQVLDRELFASHLDRAIGSGQEALSLTPDDPDLLSLLAFFHAQKILRMPAATGAERNARLAVAEQGYRLALKSLGIRESAAGYVWAVSCFSFLYKEKNLAAQLTQVDRIFRMINRIEELDPDYFFGVSARLRSRLARATPKVILKLIGGKVARLEADLERAVRLDPDFLENRVDQAIFLRHLGRKEEAKGILASVLQKDPDVRPDLRAFNRHSYRRAIFLWKQWTGGDYPHPRDIGPGENALSPENF